MPQPHGTYLRTHRVAQVRHQAQRSRTDVASARTRALADFYTAIAETSEADLDDYYRWFSGLVADLEKGEPTTKSDKTRKKFSKVVGTVRAILEKAKDIKQLEGRLQAPVYPVLRGPVDLPSDGSALALVIAICQILEVLVRIRRRTKSDA